MSDHLRLDREIASNMNDIPIIDLGAATGSSTIPASLLQACATWGFFYVRHHGIPQAEIDDCFQIVKDFFAQSEDVKNQAPYVPAQNAGFKPARSYSSANKEAGAQKSDPRESFSMNKWVSKDAAASTPLPLGLAEHRETLLAFQRRCWGLANIILEQIAQSLELPQGYFLSQHHQDQANFDNFEIMHYPKPELNEVSSHRISPHTDWGSITCLFQQKIGGLQVRPPRYTSPQPSPDEEWFDAPVLDDCILVNIGDMMEHWTAGKLRSTWHRVTSNTKYNREHGVSDRWCMAYFLHPDKDSVLKPIQQLKQEGYVSRYEGEGRTAAEHIAARIGNAHNLTGVKMQA